MVLAPGTLQETFIHSFTYSFTYFLIASHVSGIGLVAWNKAHRNTTQTSEFTIHLSEGLRGVAETENSVQPSGLIILG